MASEEVSVTVSKGKPKSSSKVRRVEIEKADNGGFTVVTFFDNSSGGSLGKYVEPNRSVFTDIDSAMDHVCSTLSKKKKP